MNVKRDRSGVSARDKGLKGRPFLVLRVGVVEQGVVHRTQVCPASVFLPQTTRARTESRARACRTKRRARAFGFDRFKMALLLEDAAQKVHAGAPDDAVGEGDEELEGGDAGFGTLVVHVTEIVLDVRGEERRRVVDGTVLV
jgi:hypothetical protein